MQELADAKKKFVHMTRRRQAEHTAKVALHTDVRLADVCFAHRRLRIARYLALPLGAVDLLFD